MRQICAIRAFFCLVGLIVAREPLSWLNSRGGWARYSVAVDLFAAPASSTAWFCFGRRLHLLCALPPGRRLGLFSNLRRRLCFALIAADSLACAAVAVALSLSFRDAAAGYVSVVDALLRGPSCLLLWAARRVSSSRVRCLQPAPCRDDCISNAGGAAHEENCDLGFARVPQIMSPALVRVHNSNYVFELCISFFFLVSVLACIV